MYAVIQTGGKQYRVRPGDLIVVEKLEGDVGAELTFDKVLMLGGEQGVSLGSALEGAVVRATLIETRKGEKVKVFKKIRRQGYRRTQGHRQFESVLRITGLEGAGQSLKWDGVVDLTPRSELQLRARGLASTATAATPAAEAPAAAKPAKKTAKAVAPKAVAPKVEAAAEEAAPKKAKAPKAEAAAASEEAAPAKAKAPKQPKADAPKGDA
jgi:large subunit ribosomal protein L21